MASHFADAMDRRIRAAMRAALIRACREVRDLIREKISEPVINGVRSEPFEPPYKELGTLWKSYKWQVKGAGNPEEIARVFTDYIVAKYLEEGTANMDARPHFNKVWKAYGFRRHVKQYFREEMAHRTQNDFGGGIMDFAD